MLCLEKGISVQNVSALWKFLDKRVFLLRGPDLSRIRDQINQILCLGCQGWCGAKLEPVSSFLPFAVGVLSSAYSEDRPGIQRQIVLLSAINCLVSKVDYLFSHFHIAAPSLWVCPVHSLVHSFIQQVYNDDLLWPGPELSLKKLSHFFHYCCKPFLFEVHHP